MNNILIKKNLDRCTNGSNGEPRNIHGIFFVFFLCHVTLIKTSSQLGMNSVLFAKVVLVFKKWKIFPCSYSHLALSSVGLECSMQYLLKSLSQFSTYCFLPVLKIGPLVLINECVSTEVKVVIVNPHESFPCARYSSRSIKYINN